MCTTAPQVLQTCPCTTGLTGEVRTSLVCVYPSANTLLLKKPPSWNVKPVLGSPGAWQLLRTDAKDRRFSFRQLASPSCVSLFACPNPFQLSKSNYLILLQPPSSQANLFLSFGEAIIKLLFSLGKSWNSVNLFTKETCMLCTLAFVELPFWHGLPLENFQRCLALFGYSVSVLWRADPEQKQEPSEAPLLSTVL